MGKQKRERRKPHKQNPTGLPSVKDFEAEQSANATNEDYESALQRVYEEIQSGDVEERLSGLHTAESLACDTEHAVRMAQNGIARTIGPMLVDQNVIVRASSANTLRSIADNGKVEAQKALLKDDIMTPLCVFLKQYYSDWQPKSSPNEKAKATDEKEALVQAVTLLWILCEHNEFAVKCCNQEDLVSLLTNFFDVSIYDIEITTVIMQCLLSVSEDNPTVVKKLKSHEGALVELLNLETDKSNASEVLCLKTVICGLLMNLANEGENNPTSTVRKAIHVLSETLSIDSGPLLSTLTSILPHEKNSFSSSAKRKVQESRRMIGAQQQALEILANLCTEDQEDENASDLSDSDCELDGIDDICMDDKLYKTVSSVPLEIVEVFDSCRIVEKVWEKTKGVDKDTVEILEQSAEGKAVLKQIHTLNCRTYICLNNLLSTLEIDALGGMENVYRIWMETGAVVFKNARANDIELLESATAAMRAAVQRLSEAKANIFNRLTLADIEPMLNGQRQCSNDNVKVNLIRILGNLALILMNNDTPEAKEIIKHVSTFLLETSVTETQVGIMAEALDTIMDLFAEDDTDQLASEIKLLEKFNSLIPVFKNKMKQQRKALGDSVAVVSTVNTNIRRFIRYKEKRLRNL